jgi:hypothetical protein
MLEREPSWLTLNNTGEEGTVPIAERATSTITVRVRDIANTLPFEIGGGARFR